MLLAGSTKQAWVDKYAEKILQIWNTWQTPLGIDKTYSEHLKKDLSEYFEDPLKKDLIEVQLKARV